MCASTQLAPRKPSGRLTGRRFGTTIFYAPGVNRFEKGTIVAAHPAFERLFASPPAPGAPQGDATRVAGRVIRDFSQQRGCDLIVEFFGPPGSGKTTLALTLADRLRRDGHPVSLRLSARPGEKPPRTGRRDPEGPPAPPGAPSPRSASPAYELLVKVTHGPDEPSRGKMFNSPRMRQYLLRLSNAWTQAGKNRNIWIFDQAYIQAVASIVMVQPPMPDEAIVALLEVAPHSDVAIRVAASPGDIGLRLGRRPRRVYEGLLFEDAEGDPAGHAALAERIEGLLRRRDRRVLSLRSGEGDEPGDDLGVAAQAIVAMLSEAYAQSS